MQENVAAPSAVSVPFGRASIPYYKLPATLMGLNYDPLSTLDALHRDYGDIVYMPVPFKPTYFVFSPELIHKILVKDAKSFQKSINYDEFDPLLGKGLVTANDELWQKQRTLFESTFTMLQLKSFVPSIQKHAKAWLSLFKANLQSSKPFTCKVGEEMMSLTYVILGEALFGKDLEGSTATVAKNLPIVTEYLMKRIYIRVPKWLPTFGYTQYKKALNELDAVVFELIEKELAQKNDESSHLLSRLVKASQTDYGMTKKQLRDEVMTMLLAGHETTANALSWTLYCLASAPTVVQRMRDEIREHAGDGEIDFAVYKKLNYARAVLQEGLRLYPPAYFISRQARDSYDLGAYQVSSSSLFYIPVWSVHRRADIWHNPTKFDPERFLDVSLTMKQRMAYFPFGSGPRRCIGSELAMIEAVIILSYIIREIDLLAPKGEIKPQPSLTLRAAHLSLEFKRHI